eukprot:5881681-Lingulodinium_polyedra.AAC.1
MARRGGSPCRSRSHSSGRGRVRHHEAIAFRVPRGGRSRRPPHGHQRRHRGRGGGQALERGRGR